MADVIQCPQCQSPLRIREEYAGRKLKCPKCATIIDVPASSGPRPSPAPEAPAVLAVGEEIRASAPPAPVRLEAVEEGPPPMARAPAYDDPRDDDRPRRRKSFKPCPRCGASNATRVTWTPWGSFYGPAMFTHVRCPDCGYKYNGRTGRSNLIPAIFFVLIPLVLILAILGGLFYLLFIYRARI